MPPLAALVFEGAGRGNASLATDEARICTSTVL
jgi:hypothetical protein